MVPDDGIPMVFENFILSPNGFGNDGLSMCFSSNFEDQ